VEKFNHSFAPPLHTTAITYPLMAYKGSNSGGEQFDSTPPATNDEYKSDAGETFFIALKTWTLEQKKILQSWLDDWKQCKSGKSKKPIIEGALK
jgi:hypothetical protein